MGATVTTTTVTNIEQTGASLSASYTGASSEPTEVGFRYGTSSSSLTKTVKCYNYSGTEYSFSAEVEGLSAGTTYYVQSYVVVDAFNRGSYVNIDKENNRIIGYTTRMDLSKVGGILLMALVGIILASVVNIFLGSETLYWVITYIGVLVFVGLTAYDTNKLRQIYTQYGEVNETGHKLALMGALTLYLDFINLFLYLLRIFGNRR